LIAIAPRRCGEGGCIVFSPFFERGFFPMPAFPETTSTPWPGAAETTRREARLCVVRHFDAVFAAADPRPALARSARPTLCLTGACTVPPTQRIAGLLQAALPHAEHTALRAAGHMGPLTQSAAVNAVITDFLLRQVEPTRPAAALLCTETTTTA
jgi:pimeloyl-ACP methyl ester carboxylesterase